MALRGHTSDHRSRAGSPPMRRAGAARIFFTLVERTRKRTLATRNRWRRVARHADQCEPGDAALASCSRDQCVGAAAACQAGPAGSCHAAVSHPGAGQPHSGFTSVPTSTAAEPVQASPYHVKLGNDVEIRLPPDRSWRPTQRGGSPREATGVPAERRPIEWICHEPQSLTRKGEADGRRGCR